MLRTPYTRTGIEEVGRRARRAREYISDVTCELLSTDPGRTCHLRAVLDACREQDRVDLFTLNHDLTKVGSCRSLTTRATN